MVYLRYLLIIILLIPLTAFMTITLVAMKAEEVVSSSDLLEERLLSADVYRFVLGELATTALEDTREIPSLEFSRSISGNPLEMSGLTTQQIVDSLNRALPPERLQAMVEANLESIFMYITGDRNAFTIRVDVSDRLPEITTEAGVLLESADTHSSIVKPILAELSDMVYEELTDAGAGLERVQLLESMNVIFDKEWANRNIPLVYETAELYLTGQTDSFEVRINLSDREDEALRQVQKLAEENGWYTLTSENIVDVIVRGAIGRNRSMELTPGLEIQMGELVAIFGNSIHPSQLESAYQDMLREIVAYVFDASDARVVIDLSGMKDRARATLIEVARSRLKEIVDGLPSCTDGNSAWDDHSVNSGVPDCFPDDWESYHDIALTWLDDTENELADMIDTSILVQIPDEVEFADEDVWALASVSSIPESVEETRRLVRAGIVYSSNDMKNDLNSETIQLIDRAREAFQGELEFTACNFLASRKSAECAATDLSIESASARWVEMLSVIKWAFIAAVVLLATLAGLVGGRTILSRIAWGAGCLGLALAVIFALLGSIYGRFEYLLSDLLWETLPQAMPESTYFQATQSVIVAKAIELILDSTRTAAHGIASTAAICAAIAIMTVLAVAIVSRVRRGRLQGR